VRCGGSGLQGFGRGDSAFLSLAISRRRGELRRPLFMPGTRADVPLVTSQNHAVARSCAANRVKRAQKARKFTDLYRFSATGRKNAETLQNRANRREMGPGGRRRRRHYSKSGDGHREAMRLVARSAPRRG